VKETGLNVVVLWEVGFPCVDCVAPTQDALRAALGRSKSLQFVSVKDLPAALSSNTNLFVNPYGSAFPKSAWTAFTDYLRKGGSWVNLGGAPVSRPVRWENGAWLVETPQPAYGKQLSINQAFPIDLPKTVALRCPPLDADLEAHFHLFQPRRAWSLQVRFTNNKDFPDEGGSSGSREAVLRPLVVAEENGRVLAAPIVAIDRLNGDYAGGRWVLANCEGALPIPADLIKRLCDYATRPRAQLDIRPSFACYYPGEMAAISVTTMPSTASEMRINLRVYSRDTQKEVYAHIFKAASNLAPAVVQTSPFPIKDPGLYIVRAYVEAEGHSKPIAFAESGFWVYDRHLMSPAKPISVDRDYFIRDGRTYPITGTTYMSGDTHRKFLFEPNPAVWDTDFAAMAAAGVNMVRTGFWTGSKRAMLDTGALDEGVLRAFMAFLLTARRYDIPVIFNFFAFLPEAWGGENPFLDPKALAAQSAFLAAFARRFANVNDLLWDFINEPSFSSLERVWSTRPNYDRFEKAAWSDWLAAQGVSDDEWRERWRLTPNDPLDLPALEDFNDQYIFQDTHPIRALDYRLFAQEKFTEWTAHMVRVVRENGNEDQLVTVGQDEGGTGDRPNPHFYGSAVDYTTNHSWWQNDDLLWDSVITKTPDKPNLIQETGVMFVENVDGGYRRSPEEARNLLERKMALSFAGGCAGFIQWLWNTNIYMDSDNEVGIGFLRADGSEKPELAAFRGVARFFAANAHLMAGRVLEEACIVIPYSNMFSVRNLADAATRRAVRTLEYSLGIPCRTVSEYRAEEVGDAKLIVLPSPRILTEECWQTLLAKVNAGAALLVTGFIEEDEYWRPVERLGVFGLKTTAVSVSRSEPFTLHKERKDRTARFESDKIQKLDRAEFEGDTPTTRWVKHGKGHIYYCALPLELAQDPASTEALYKAVNSLSIKGGIETCEGVLSRKVEFESCSLWLFVNETSVEARVDRNNIKLRIPAGRIGMAFVDKSSGVLLAKYEVK
jgi:hypothetical protein